MDTLLSRMRFWWKRLNKGVYDVVRYGAIEGEGKEYLYSANTKKVSASPSDGGLSTSAITPQNPLLTIRIQDALEIFKDNFPEGLSRDVLNHYGMQRPSGGSFANPMYSRITFDDGYGNQLSYAMPEIKQKADGTYTSDYTIGGQKYHVEGADKAELEQAIKAQNRNIRRKILRRSHLASGKRPNCSSSANLNSRPCARGDAHQTHRLFPL